MPPSDSDAHPDGASLFGVMDLVGNVWQWTDEYCDAHTCAAILKGGSHYQPQGSRWYFPQAYRLSEHGKYLLMAPSLDRAATVGFRCVQDLPTEEGGSSAVPAMPGLLSALPEDAIQRMKPSVIILAYNSVDTLGATLASSAGNFRRSPRRRLLQHGRHGSAHAGNTAPRSFSMPSKTMARRETGRSTTWCSAIPWQLHLDADERLTPELIASMRSLPENPAHSGFLIARLVQFLGRQMRHGGMSPTWHLRLFRNGAGRCEERKYDQHFYLSQGSAGQLQGSMIDEIRMSLSEWTARHNRWSDAEVMEQTAAMDGVRIRPRFWGNPLERKRFLRGLYNGAPLFVRPYALFFYRYFLRLGFLDGREGFHLLDPANILVPLPDRRQTLRAPEKKEGFRIEELCLKFV